MSAETRDCVTACQSIKHRPVLSRACAIFHELPRTEKPCTFHRTPALFPPGCVPESLPRQQYNCRLGRWGSSRGHCEQRGQYTTFFRCWLLRRCKEPVLQCLGVLACSRYFLQWRIVLYKQTGISRGGCQLKSSVLFSSTLRELAQFLHYLLPVFSPFFHTWLFLYHHQNHFMYMKEDIYSSPRCRILAELDSFLQMDFWNLTDTQEFNPRSRCDTGNGTRLLGL